MTKVKRALMICLLTMVIMFAGDHDTLKAGNNSDPYSLPIDNIVNLKRLVNYSLEEQADSMVKFSHYDESATIKVAKKVELIKDPPDTIDNYDVIGLRYHFHDGTTNEIFLNKPDEKK